MTGRRWRLWDQFAVRGAGFPAAGVLRLAPSGLAQAADKLEERDWDAFSAQFHAAAVQTAHDLQDIARLPAFRTAVAWQNRPVLDSGIAPFLAWTPTAAGRTSMPRQREELVAHYWQRFCVKNDTIGFFGPVGWGRWDEHTAGAAVDPGIGLVAESTVYLASWAVDGIAAVLDADPRARPWIPPRRMPFVRVEGDRVVVAGRPPRTVDPAVAAVLAACDGVRSAHDLAEAMPGVDVPAVLDDLVRQRLVTRRLEIPADTHPERGLRAWLARVGDKDLRGRGERALAALDSGRDRVGAARDPDGLVAALSALERDFVARTDTAAVREKSARTAPCRALVYADARRSATVRLGPQVRDALAPLEPLLASAAWLTVGLTRTVLEHVRAVYDTLVARKPVDLASFWFACLPALHGPVRADAVRLQREFRRRWAEILTPPPGTRRHRLRLHDIAGPVAERFDDDGPQWTAARYMSPDVMIAADSVSAVENGVFELVLGELHLAANTLGASLFVHQHPAPAELLALTDRDHPWPRLMPLLAKEHRARLSARIRHCLVRPQDYQVALVDFTADPGRDRSVNSADATVTDVDGDLTVVLPDGARFPIVDVFGHVLTTLAMDLFELLPEAPHTPRVTVDRLVVARETWRLPVADAEFAAVKDEARRFVAARRWRAAHDLPRHVFVVSAGEPRPFYVDFDSPTYVNILAKALRRLVRTDVDATVTVTEMLPTPDQAWLTDDRGEAYTSELRFVAVEQAADDRA
jgi:hypothetical protein